MTYYGDIVVGSTLTFHFNTQTSAGAPITLGGTPSLTVYQDSNNTQFSTGVTLTVDADSVTGMHRVAVNTTTGYATGADYRVVIAAGTVDGQSVAGTVVGSFSVENRPVNATKIGGVAMSLDPNLSSDVAAIKSKTDLIEIVGLAGQVHVGATPTTTTFETDTSAIISKATSFFNNARISFTSGNLKGLSFLVTGWNTTTNVLTVGTMPTAPANDDTFVII